MRVALGVAVFSGMLGVTIFGIFFTPVFYVVIRWFTERGGAPGVPEHVVAVAEPAHVADGSGVRPDGETVVPAKGERTVP
jgi:hypothetical protein